MLIKKKNNRSIQKKKRQYKEIYKYIKINILNIIKKNQSKGTPPVASEVLKKKKLGIQRPVILNHERNRNKFLTYAMIKKSVNIGLLIYLGIRS